MLCESVTICKDIYKDVLSVLLNSVNDEKSFAKNLLSSMPEIGANLFSTIETHCGIAKGGHRSFGGDISILQEQCKLLCERLNNTVALSALSDAQYTKEKESTSRLSVKDYKGVDFSEESACWNEKLSNELDTIRDKYITIVQDHDHNKRVLEEWNSRYLNLEKEFQVVQQERDSLLDKMSKSSQNLRLVSEEKQMVFERYKSEVQKRENLEQEIKQFSVAFASRQRSLASFHSDFKSRIADLRTQNSAVGC